MKKISVIIPIYDVEDYLIRCLDSVINQTYKNLEIILVNDGSPDKSGEICDNYAKIDDRIIVVHQENAGVSIARNKGLEISSGEYISFIDPDDYIELNMYEIMVNELEKNDVKIVCCNWNNVYDDKTEPNDVSLARLGVVCCQQAYENIYFKNYNPALWNKLICKEICDNLFFKAGLSIAQDAHFSARLFANVSEVLFIEKRFVNYYIRQTSTTVQKMYNVDKLHMVIDVWNDIIELIDSEMIAHKLKAKNFANSWNFYFSYYLVSGKKESKLRDKVFEYKSFYYKSDMFSNKDKLLLSVKKILVDTRFPNVLLKLIYKLK